MSRPTAPTLNLNGTSGTTFMQEYSEATDALRTALDALKGMTVHGRDHQTSPDPGSYQKAAVEHRARIRDVTRVLDEVLTLALDVDQQMRQGRTP